MLLLFVLLLEHVEPLDAVEPLLLGVGFGLQAASEGQARIRSMPVGFSTSAAGAR